MASFGQENLILIISRYNLNPQIIPSFKIILPTLQLISPLRLFTSMEKEITLTNVVTLGYLTFNSLYESLVYHLENEQGEVSLNNTLTNIYNEKLEQERENRKKNQQQTNLWKFRICVVGQEIISWDIVMKYKLKNIIIDTIGQNKRLQQISFATGGLFRPLMSENITKLFMTIFSLSTQSRKKLNFLSLSKESQIQAIQFTVDCVCCKNGSRQLWNECYLCSKCLAVHCNCLIQRCASCGGQFQIMNLRQKPC